MNHGARSFQAGTPPAANGYPWGETTPGFLEGTCDQVPSLGHDAFEMLLADQALGV